MVGMGKNTKMSKTWVCLLGILDIFIKRLLAVRIVLSALYTSLFLILRLTLLAAIYIKETRKPIHHHLK